MKFISPGMHGVIDYLTVAFLLASPTIFSLSGTAAIFTYVLAFVYLLFDILTNTGVGLFKVISFPLHGFIESYISVVLVILAYTLFKDDTSGKLFYIIFGTVELYTWLLTDYKSVPIAVAEIAKVPVQQMDPKTEF